MEGLLKYILFIALCMVAAFISAHFFEYMSVDEAFTEIIASVALYRTCHNKRKE